jgi:hypothetical protein
VWSPRSSFGHVDRDPDAVVGASRPAGLDELLGSRQRLRRTQNADREARRLLVDDLLVDGGRLHVGAQDQLGRGDVDDRDQLGRVVLLEDDVRRGLVAAGHDEPDLVPVLGGARGEHRRDRRSGDEQDGERETADDGPPGPRRLDLADRQERPRGTP